MAATKTSKRRKNQLAELLEMHPVQTSSELISRLKASGVSEENARQVLRRHANSPGIWRSQQLRLPKDERLFAHRSIVGTAAFYKGVAEKLRETSRWGMSRCMEVLARRHVLHRTDVMRLLAVSPNGMKDNAGRRLYEREVAGLEELGAVVVHRNTPLESLIAPHCAGDPGVDDLAREAAASIRVEALLARILVERLRRQNMFSWNRIDVAGPDIPYRTFNGQIFSAFAFSYLSPLVRWKAGRQPTPCPVLLDVYQGLCVVAQVHSFLQRIERATHRAGKVLSALGVIAAKDFEPEAWSLARRKGLMTVSFRQMFGDEAVEAMVLMERLLHDLSHGGSKTVVEEEFKKFSVLLDDLKTNPVISTLRSIGLEAVTGLTLRALGYEGVELGRVVPWQETTRDVDAFGFRGDEIRIVECKAYHKHKSLLPEEVTKFFTQTVPALKKFLTDQGKTICRCQAEIWTTGPLGRLAREEMHALPPSKGDTWNLLHGKQVRELMPRSIRARSWQLLDAIRMDRTGGDESENAEDDEELQVPSAD